MADPKQKGPTPPFPRQEQQPPGTEQAMEPRPDHVEAMFHLVRYAVAWMKPGSAIINTASVQAYHPSPAILDYATTKGAIVTFTKGLAQHLIERGIRVNCVAPGPVWTPLVVASFSK